MKTNNEINKMLKEIGYSSIEELFNFIPNELKLKELNLPQGLWEGELIDKLEEIGNKNTVLNKTVSFLGGGVYYRFIPSALQSLLSRGEFVTAYTPYQPELSQGTLQAIYEYQTMICYLTGLDIANASLYDGASAAAEAALMAARIKNKNKILISKTVHPEYREVVKTYANGKDLELIELEYINGITDISNVDTDNIACIIVQQPNFFGNIEDLEVISNFIHSHNGLFIVIHEPVSLGILKPPAYFGADIVVGDGQSLGNSLSFGGPHVGFMACKKEFLRHVPGRIIGETVDKEGKTAYVMTLQTREQHIRREKATSNICSNQALNALAVTIYLSLLGKQGLKEVANISLQRSHYLADKISKLKGFSLKFNTPFFNEFVVECPTKASNIFETLLHKNILVGLDLGKWYKELDNCLLIAVTEMNSKTEIDYLIDTLNDLGS